MRGSLAASLAASLTVGLSLFANAAQAHIAISSGPAYANSNQEITFGVGHGCEGLDTFAVTVDIPASVTSARALPSEFGAVTVTTNDANVVTGVTWQRKSDDDLAAKDTNYYKLTLRIKVPNTPFTTIYFPVHQTCKNKDTGATVVVDWVATTANEDHDAGAAEPAAALLILPAKKAGWNKFTVPAAIPDLNVYFADAQIVWKGTSAFSANPATVQQIGTTAGVTPLTTLAAGDEIWVKY